MRSYRERCRRATDTANGKQNTHKEHIDEDNDTHQRHHWAVEAGGMRFAGSPSAPAPNHHAKERRAAALVRSFFRRYNAPGAPPGAFGCHRTCHDARPIPLVIPDYHLSDMRGDASATTKIMMITADVELDTQAGWASVDQCLIKPYPIRDLLTAPPLGYRMKRPIQLFICTPDSRVGQAGADTLAPSQADSNADRASVVWATYANLAALR
jgi:hypothetical protein